ncbi:hypothetical protein ElyMa_001813700 [Elysia marginata]|uniref:Uncharacterized protein n=1 Tax=Elysia marginata TaxID=1093978 RepID=A0AAV4EHE8_9GAST|nr:hypothetical protein ElyMa_001813700 [Elysia marginata]
MPKLTTRFSDSNHLTSRLGPRGEDDRPLGLAPWIRKFDDDDDDEMMMIPVVVVVMVEVIIDDDDDNGDVGVDGGGDDDDGDDCHKRPTFDLCLGYFYY